MSSTDEPDSELAEVTTSEGEQPILLPSRPSLWWPAVRALREMGNAATHDEITEHVADSLNLTQQQRMDLKPSGHETKLRNRIGWALFELKEIGVIHYPKPGHRALTELGLSIDEEQIAALRAAFSSNKSSSQPEQQEGRDQTGTPTAWVIRAGGRGEHADDCIEHGVAGIGFGRLPDLRGLSSREDLEAAVRQDDPDASRMSIANRVGQVWRFGKELHIGDLVVMPQESGGKVALGIVESEYWYDADRDPDWRHHWVSVDWKRTGVPRSALQQDLQSSLGSQQTIFALTRNDAPWRIQQLLETGKDPGPRVDADSAMAELPAGLAETTVHDNVPGPDDPRPDLDGLAESLLVGVDFLRDIVSLLEDKGQVILYGPPGTGKTYLARELAKELAPDEACRALVQFHPSTSYEDFFEGYRPAGTGDDGGIRYELTPGPLARMAKRASEAPERRHVMIIDEINRGNLPRVLGELLFLLEYRDESVQTLYRPEQPFSLPRNLWFIGTMNTADRSIALVDAALRRRFHFVPFFPDSGPMAGLLGRWLEGKDEPSWVGDLVDAVNDELREVLEGSHLLLGPSHFMTEYGSSPASQRERLRRIWEYSIEPFFEDQFFGDPDRIARFRFDAVMRHLGPATESDVGAADGGDGPESADGPEDRQAEADRDAAADPSPTQTEN